MYLWERGEGKGARRLPKLPEGNLSLSADFWLARGIDDVTVQKSADSVASYAHSKLLRSVKGSCKHCDLLAGKSQSPGYSIPVLISFVRSLFECAI